MKQVGGREGKKIFGYDGKKKFFLGEGGGDFQEKFFLMMVSEKFFF